MRPKWNDETDDELSMLEFPTDRKKRVLLIDDNADFRQLVCVLLRDRFIIVPAADAHDGWNKALVLKPDVALLDIGLPGITGHQMLNRFRDSAVFRDLPVMMLTGDARRESVLKSLELGADDYVLKDSICSRGDELGRRIETLLTVGRRPQKPSRPPESSTQPASRCAGELQTSIDLWD